MRTLLRWLLRITPLRGARECRVPGWRPAVTDTTRLEMSPRHQHIVTSPRDTVIYLDSTASGCPHPECRRRPAAAPPVERRHDAGV